MTSSEVWRLYSVDLLGLTVGQAYAEEAIFDPDAGGILGLRTIGVT